MELLSILAKLKDAKELLTKTIPDGLDGAADVMAKVSEATKEAAAFLRSLGESPLMTTAGGKDAEECEKCCEELRTLAEECRQIGNQPPMTTRANSDGRAVTGIPPVMAALLAKLIANLIERLLANADK